MLKLLNNADKDKALEFCYANEQDCVLIIENIENTGNVFEINKFNLFEEKSV